MDIYLQKLYQLIQHNLKINNKIEEKEFIFAFRIFSTFIMNTLNKGCAKAVSKNRKKPLKSNCLNNYKVQK